MEESQEPSETTAVDPSGSWFRLCGLPVEETGSKAAVAENTRTETADSSDG